MDRVAVAAIAVKRKNEIEKIKKKH